MEQGDSLKRRFQRKLERMRRIIPMQDFIFEELFECKRVFLLQLRVPVHTGDTQHLQAFIAHHCSAYHSGEDPRKGGLRKAVALDQESIEGLAMDMTEKVGVMDIPLGGGKAGIRLKVDFVYTRDDHARMNKAFVVEADKVRAIGPRIYSTASDFGTSEADCDDIMKEYIALHEAELGSKRGVATGKSVENFGHPARKNATGRGGLIVARKVLSLLGVKNAGMSVAIEGFGNVGRPTFELAENEEYNFKPVAVSDVNGGIYNSHGLDVRRVIAYYEAHKTFTGYREADVITSDEILHLPCDVLIPAAIQNRLTEKTAGRVLAKYVVELANGPTTEEGERILLDKGIVVIPDVVANAGGVVMSWQELNMNKEHDRHAVELRDEEGSANRKLEKIMHHNTEQVVSISKKEGLTLRDAASYLAFSRLIPRLREKQRLYL